jgi:hypothetical protein
MTTERRTPRSSWIADEPTVNYAAFLRHRRSARAVQQDILDVRLIATVWLRNRVSRGLGSRVR